MNFYNIVSRAFEPVPGGRECVCETERLWVLESVCVCMCVRVCERERECVCERVCV